MVAENPLSNGDDRGPSLPPEPPDSIDPIATPQYKPSMITVKALIATIEEEENYEYDVEKTLTTKQAQHPPVMVKISPTPISE